MMYYGNKFNLIVCQKSKISDWVEHISQNYDVNVYNLTTKSEFNNFIREWCSGTHVGVINYELAWRRNELTMLKNYTLMLDESSLIQNKKAKTEQSRSVNKKKIEPINFFDRDEVYDKIEQAVIILSKQKIGALITLVGSFFIRTLFAEFCK